MLKNYQCKTLNEDCLTKYTNKDIFNFFFVNDCKIIYILNDNKNLIGIITIRDFLYQMDSLNVIQLVKYDFVKILYNNEEQVLCEAKELLDTKNISTGIPVIDANNALLYEIKMEIGIESSCNEGEILKKIEMSNYLKVEYLAFKKIMSRQSLIILSNKQERNSRSSNIKYIEDLEDAYEFLRDNKSLLIDTKCSIGEGREIIYQTLNNGYSEKIFYKTIIREILNENFSRCLRIVEESNNFLKTWIDKNFGNRILINSNSIWINYFVDNIKDINVDVIIEKGLFRNDTIGVFQKSIHGILYKKWQHEALLRVIDCEIQIKRLNQ